MSIYSSSVRSVSVVNLSISDYISFRENSPSELLCSHFIYGAGSGHVILLSIMGSKRPNKNIIDPFCELAMANLLFDVKKKKKKKSFRRPNGRLPLNYRLPVFNSLTFFIFLL